MNERSRPRSRVGLILGLVALTALMPRATEAQPDGANCTYRDARGNCTSTRPFREQKPKAPQVIVIQSKPDGAEVWLDGEPVGQTPLTLDQSLRSGVHALRVQKANHVERVGGIRVKTYGRQVFSVELPPWPVVRVAQPEQQEPRSAKPRLRIDGRSRDDDSWSQPIPLPPGEHVIEVARAGYKTWEKTEVLEVGRTYVYTPELKRITGSLAIETNLVELPVVRVPDCACSSLRPGYEDPYTATEKCPGEAEDWGLVGPEKLTKQDLTPGGYCVEFRIEGLGVQRRQLTVSPDQEAFYRFELSPPDKSETVPLERFWGPWRLDSERQRCDGYNQGKNDHRAETCLRLGVVMHKDQDDLAAAARSYAGACNAGSKRACEIYGWFVLHGKGGLDRDPLAARAFYKKACSPGLERACYARHAPGSAASGETDDPSRHYTLVHDNTDPMPHDSLVHDAWASLEISYWPTGLHPTDLPDDMQKWNLAVTAQFDLPLHGISQSSFLRSLAGDKAALTVGWEVGWGTLDLPNEIGGRFERIHTFLGGATLKIKWFPTRKLYAALEGGFNNFGPNLAATVAWHYNWGGSRQIDSKVGFEITRLPTKIALGEPANTEWTVRVFWSFGPAMGWFVDRFARR